MPSGKHLTQEIKRDIIHQHITLGKDPEMIFYDFFRGENDRISLPWLKIICQHISSLSPASMVQWIETEMHQSDVSGRKRKLGEAETKFLLDMTTANRCMKLQRLVDKFLMSYYEDNTDFVSTDTISRTFKRAGWSRHTVERRNILKDPSAQVAYLDNISFVKAERIVDIDGTIQNPKDFQIKMGWAPEGEPATINQIVINSRSFAVHAAYTDKGFIAWQIFEGMVTDVEVCTFLFEKLEPLLLSDSFGIIDNASNQRTYRAKDALYNVFYGIFLYSAPYSPELKPIEKGFSNVKRYIREHESDGVIDPVALIERAFTFYSVIGERGHAGKKTIKYIFYN
jgi:transposase